MKFLKQAKYDAQHHSIHATNDFCDVTFIEKSNSENVNISFKYYRYEHIMDINIANKALLKLDLDSDNVNLKKADIESFKTIPFDGLTEITINNSEYTIYIIYVKSEKEFEVRIKKANCDYVVDLVFDIFE